MGFPFPVRTCKLVASYLFALIALITRTTAVEVEASSVSINKPIRKDVPDLPPWVHLSSEYIFCFCNLPVCVSTGYMCKSGGGGCFSDLLDRSMNDEDDSSYRGIHGCIELLAEKQRRSCQANQKTANKPTFQRIKHPKSLLLCCYQDMCNHMDNPDIRYILNNTFMSETISGNNKVLGNTSSQQNIPLYTDSEVWFRAAKIIVPVCGVIILCLLIFLAKRILRTESNHVNHKLGLPYVLPNEKLSCEKNYHQQHVKNCEIPLQNPLYLNEMEDSRGPLLMLPNYCDKKNKNNGKFSGFHGSDYEVLPQHNLYEDADIPTQLFYNNRNVNVCPANIIGYDQELGCGKVYNKDAIS